MEKHKKHIIFLIGLLICINVFPARAQEIKGDTIFVNAEAEVLVRFPTLPNFFNTVPSNAPYNFKTAGTGFTIIAKEENTKPTPLTVSEGGRTHHFILVFKKNINYDNDAELDYDYSTVKKIEQHIKQNEARSPLKTEVAKTDDNKKAPEKVPVPDRAPEPDKAQIYADQQKSAELEKNKQYVAITAEAKTNLDSKQYAKARDGYKQALQLKPGDLYANHQIDKIDKILQEENGAKEQEKLKSLYDGYMATGEKAMSQNKLPEARIAYQQALVIKENDQVATGRISLIDEKEKKDKEKVDLENNYANIVQNADKLFQKGDYDNAKTEYNKANDLISRPWPTDQLKNIDKIIADRISKENDQKEKLAQLAETEKKERENQKVENDYNVLIQSADNFFKAGDYDNAKAKYSMASNVINRPWPKDQITKINSIIADIALKEKTKKQKEEQQLLDEKRIRENQEIEKNYNNAIQLADKFFEDSDYSNAISAYNKAIAFINKPYPENQLKKINEIQLAQAEQKKKEKLMLAQQAATNAKYQTNIQQADLEFGKSNYINSRKLYMVAASLKPDENYPRERLSEIQNTLDKIALEEKKKKDSIAAALETKRKYDYALSIGKSYYLKGDFLNAKTAYEEAMNIKPGEAEAKSQLDLINKKLDDIAKAKELDDKYENAIVVADSQLIAKEYDSALTAYNTALEIKPSEYYPKAQVKFLQAEIIHMQKLDAELKETQVENDYLNSISIADKAMKDKDFNEAKSAYSKALKIHPDNGYALQRFKIAAYQYELQKKSIENYSTAINNNSVIDSTDKAIKGLLDSKYIFQANPIPYTTEELKVKYPGINFYDPPAEQSFNETFIKFKDHQVIFKNVLSQQPRFAVTATKNDINLVCVGINFDESLVYLKFIIQNNSKEDFLTGPMMLTWTKKNGNIIKLYPFYIFPPDLPILKPGNQTTIVYVCKSYIIIDQDTLEFEMTDRLNKTKLQLTLPASIYTQEMDRENK